VTPLLIIALTLWGEARGEGEAGIRAVASVIWNRAGYNPANCEAVCLKPYQFSCWNGKRGEKLRQTRPAGAAWDICEEVAEEMLRGTFRLSTDADHYMTLGLYNSLQRPAWADKMEVKCIIGNHIFLKEGECY